MQAEAALVTRNVQIRAVSSSAQGFIECHAAASFTASWTLFRYLGATGISLATQGGGLRFELTTGTLVLSYCCIADGERAGLVFGNTGASGAFSVLVEHLTVYNTVPPA